jgi:membrane-associated phospholipid phosphatase
MLRLNEQTRESTVVSEFPAPARSWAALSRVPRPSEWVIILYFTYTALLTVSFGLSPARRAVGFAVPILLWLLAYAHTQHPRPWSGVLRDWLPPLLVLLAYWQVDWFRSPAHVHDYELAWLRLDQTVLHSWGLKALIESAGPIGPAFMEFCYALLYTIPALCLGLLYRFRQRARIDQFLFVFLLGTFAAYALLPHFPSDSPRLEFPGVDLPTYMTSLRRLNIWLLGHGDIQTSVFPSGHVATAFSSAFGMMWVLPERPWVGRSLLLLAALIATSTVYGRYHYLADALASLSLSAAAISFSRAVRNA